MVEVAVYTFRSRGAQCAGDVEVVDGEAPRRFPYSHRASPPFPSSARELGDLTTNLINRLQRVTPSENRTIEEIAQLSKDQDAKTKDHVGRIQSMLDSLAVRLCDETEFATKAQSDSQSHDNDHGKSRFGVARRDQDDQMISQSDAVLRRRHRLSLLGQTENKLDYVLGTHHSKDHRDACNSSLGEVHSPRQRHIRASRQMANIPSFLVRTDSEKHDDSTLARRLLTVMMREMEEQSFIGKATPDRIGSCEKQIPARKEGNIEHAGVLARRPETKKRKHDAAVRKWSTRSCEEKKKQVSWRRRRRCWRR